MSYDEKYDDSDWLRFFAFRKFRTSRPLFFARKWEEYVYQSSVNKMDFKIYGEYPPGIRESRIAEDQFGSLNRSVDL